MYNFQTNRGKSRNIFDQAKENKRKNEHNLDRITRKVIEII